MSFSMNNKVRQADLPTLINSQVTVKVYLYSGTKRRTKRVGWRVQASIFLRKSFV